jgi:hypothetical protein
LTLPEACNHSHSHGFMHLLLQVSYDADIGILSPADTYGIRWTASSPQAQAALLPQLTAVVAAKTSNCYNMEVGAHT